MKIDVKNYDGIARDLFTPVYPVIAQQIVSYTGITRGTCLDIGCGSGYLGAALARVTDLFIHFFDQSAEMLTLVDRTIAENNLRARSAVLQGDVSAIGLPDASVDLAVSRGSIFFWEDLPQAFKEIDRLLAPGGYAYIGGGFGSRELKETIERDMASRDKGSRAFSDKVRRNLGPEMRTRFEAGLAAAGIDAFTILQSEDIGLWVVMKK